MPDCPGDKTLTSGTHTATAYGVFSASGDAEAQAKALVQADLNHQAAAYCGQCSPSLGPIVYAGTTRCRRLWYTLFIVIQCKASWAGSAVVHCQ